MLLHLKIRNEKFFYFLFFFLLPLFLAGQTDLQENVKAVFIYNFTKYINWDYSDSLKTFDIAVMGESQIIEPLKVIAEKRQVEDRRIRIRQFKHAENTDSTQILFVPQSEKHRMHEIMQHLAGKIPMLLVSEIPGALSEGIMINFVLSDGKIKFEMNLQAMKQAGLHPSSQLLKLAVRVIE